METGETISPRFSSYLATRFNMQIASSSASYNTEETTISATELDSHADSPVVGIHSRILEDTGRRAKVSGFTSDLGKPISVKVVNAAILYECDKTGKVEVLVLCNALYFPNMEVNLVPPFMMRLAGVEVDECPKFLAKDPTETNHSLYFQDSDLRIHLQLEGIVSYFPSRRPTVDELKEAEGHFILMTPNQPIWDPHTDVYKDQEYGMTDYSGNLKQRGDGTGLTICSVSHEASISDHITAQAVNYSSLDTISDPSLLIAAVASTAGHCVSSVQSKQRKGQVKPHELAERLKIPIEMARKTIQSTTQLGTRTVTEPTLTRKFQTNDRMLRYQRLATDTFMDTMFASKKAGPSKRGFKACQVFATEFGHVFVVPLQSKAGINIAQVLRDTSRR